MHVHWCWCAAPNRFIQSVVLFWLLCVEHLSSPPNRRSFVRSLSSSSSSPWPPRRIRVGFFVCPSSSSSLSPCKSPSYSVCVLVQSVVSFVFACAICACVFLPPFKNERVVFFLSSVSRALAYFVPYIRVLPPPISKKTHIIT